MNKLFLKNTIIILTSSLLIKIIASSFDIYLANKIGAEAIGVYTLIMSIYMFNITLATSGINLATTKVISEEIEKKNMSNIPLVIKKAFIYSFIFGSLSALFLIILTPYICKNWLMNKCPFSVLYILAISLPFVSLNSAIKGYFFATRKVFKTSFTQVFAQLLQIFIIWALLLKYMSKGIAYSLTSLVIGLVCEEIISFVILYLFFYKDKKKYNFIPKSINNLSKRLYKISLPIAITSYIRSFLNTIKQIIIPIRLKLSGLSYEKGLSNYGIITGMAMPIIMFSSVFVYSYSSLLIPEFSRLSIEFNKEKMNEKISKLFKVTLYFSIGVSGILMYYGKDIGNLLYNAYEVGMYIKIMAPLIVLMYLDNVIDNILKGLGKQVSVMLCNILDLAISLFSIYFLLPIFSTNGYIIVLYISEILNYSISVITLFRTTNFKFKYFDFVILPIIFISISILLTNKLEYNISNYTITIIIKVLMTTIIYLSLIKLKKSFFKYRVFLRKKEP